jgi:hypothetical protein
VTDLEIDLPALKETLWHKMRSDLADFMPSVLDGDSLMCPTCGRLLKFEHFDIEHIIPQQVLAEDPPEVRAAFTKTQRTPLTLLCRRSILLKGNKLYGNGCNSWKGRFYDRFLKELFSARINKTHQITTRHQVALFVLGYLGVFQKYGYRVALCESGVLMRRQFFSPNKFLREVPLGSQAMLFGDIEMALAPETSPYWTSPINVTIHPKIFSVGIRNVAFNLPLSHNPESFIPRAIRYLPNKHVFRPDFRALFE